MRRVILICLLFATQPSTSPAQAVRVTVGRTSSGVDWLYPPAPPSDYPVIVSGSSNTDRRSVVIAGSLRFSVSKWVAGETGLRIVPKGFEVTGPTFHMLYAEVPLLAVLQSSAKAGFFIEGGAVVGVRVLCRRFMDTVAGFHEDGCGAATTAYGRDLEPLRRWDASWEFGLGGRLPVGHGRLVAVAWAQRSLIDIQPGVLGEKMVNRVLMLTVGYEWELGRNR